MSLNNEEPIDWNALVQERRLLAQVRIFQNNDDSGYRNWLRAHPSGFVVDTDSVPPRAGMIHTSRCDHVAQATWIDDAPLRHPFSYTSPPHVKLCATTERVLVEYCRRSLPVNRDLTRCRTCM
jgi:hypothetical protein